MPENEIEWGVKFPSADTGTVFPFRSLAEQYLKEMVDNNTVWKPSPESEWETPILVKREKRPWTVVEDKH